MLQARLKDDWWQIPGAVAQRFQRRANRYRDIIAAPAAEVVAAEIDSLPAEARLTRTGELEVYLARARAIPQTLLEIGRLREITFRAAGEGTGQSCDLDRFDDTYEHLVAWNPRTREIVGGYRITRVDEAIRREGLGGLYTATLFRYDRRFLDQIGPALELGRSFVRQEYQRHPAALLSLWKGIGRYVARHPAYPVLFGPVSISHAYGREACQLMVSYLRERRRLDFRAARVRPRRPFRGPLWRGWELKKLAASLGDLDDLDKTVAAMANKPGIPVLLRHYLQLGGRVAEFNVDPGFSGALDALVIVDLRLAAARQLQRYLGKEDLAAFQRFHGRNTAHDALIQAS
jgi:putative hemolysin